MPMNAGFLLASLSMVCAIACDWNRRQRAFYLFKPLTTLLVIATALMLPAPDGTYARMIEVALVFCLFGDIALMFQGDAAFVAGLSSFLIGHLLFAAAFLHGVPALSSGHWAWIGGVYGVIGLAILMPRVGKLRIPVLAYIGVLLAMWLAADARLSQLGGGSARLVLAGASVFIASDSLLAWDRFVKPLPLAQPLILGTYFPAIMLIVASIPA